MVEWFCTPVFLGLSNFRNKSLSTWKIESHELFFWVIETNVHPLNVVNFSASYFKDWLQKRFLKQLLPVLPDTLYIGAPIQILKRAKHKTSKNYNYCYENMNFPECLEFYKKCEGFNQMVHSNTFFIQFQYNGTINTYY